MLRNSLLLLFCAAALCGQESPAPAFDVISVKHVGDVQSTMVQEGNMTRSNMQPFRYTAGSVSAKVPLQAILLEAYQVKAFQLQGPDWLNQEVYQLEARMQDGTTREVARQMLQTALAERLGLKVRREPKEFPVYVLVVVPGSNKLEEITQAPQNYGVRFGRGMLEAMPCMSLSSLTGTLQQAAGRPVLDETGKKGCYKIKLQWSADPPSEGGVMRMGADPGVISAISQLGLKLESAKRTLDNIIIEKVSKEPTEN